MLEFRILGPLEVVGDDGLVRLGGPKQRATLAILLLSANRVVSVDRLADDLYAGAPPVTAVTQVQRQVSELRRALGDPAVIETRAPGYLMHVPPGQLDLDRFEQKADEASRASTRGDAGRAAALLRDALALWRGTPFADLAAEPFAMTPIARLEEIRHAAFEQRIDAELQLGRHRELVAELEALVAEHPLREAPRTQLMLALYRSGRQTEALEVYRRGREVLASELGLEPSAALRELERAILTQDSSLEAAVVRPSVRTALLVPATDDVGSLLSAVEPLVDEQEHELIVARLVRDGSQLSPAVSSLNAARDARGEHVRLAAFTTVEPERDVVRLAANYDAELVLVEAPSGFDGAAVPDALASILQRSSADVAVLVGSVDWSHGDGIDVAFGGGEHDWAALELAGRLAAAADKPLKLLGAPANPDRGARDSSRLLADAALALQRVIGVVSEPVLTRPGPDGLAAAVAEATVVLAGISPHWRREGLGAARRALVAPRCPPTILVHRGPRPSSLAPRGSRTRYTWSIAG